jgi:hypothetical protein
MIHRSPHESFLRYRSFRWLKVAVLLVVASVAAYLWDNPLGGRRGDTPVGYALGTLSALLMLWLTSFGVRKRRYHSAGAPLRGWLSAHVYLGTTLVVLVPLHCAFQFGWNVHTLAYVLMIGAIATGLVGLVFYGSVPEQITQNRPGEKLSSLIRQVSEIDADCLRLAGEMPDVFAGAVTIAIDQTRIGGGLVAQLRGRDPRCGTARALAIVQQHAREVRGPMRAQVDQLLESLSRKDALLARIRHDVQLKSLLDLWLIAHVPLAIAALAAVAVHVFVVFYW